MSAYGKHPQNGGLRPLITDYPQPEKLYSEYYERRKKGLRVPASPLNNVDLKAWLARTASVEKIK